MLGDKHEYTLTQGVRRKYVEELRVIHTGRVLFAGLVAILVLMLLGNLFYELLTKVGVPGRWAEGISYILWGVVFFTVVDFVESGAILRQRLFARIFVKFAPEDEDDQMLQVLWEERQRRRAARTIAIAILIAAAIVAAAIIAVG